MNRRVRLAEDVGTRGRLRDCWLWVVFVLYELITFMAVAQHQPWRDEAQIWTTVRDLDIRSVFGQSPSEGRPPLWDMLVMPLAKAGLPYASMNWLHWTLALVPVFLLLFISPWPRPLRLLLPFSYYFLFEYSVVARHYVLTVLLVFSIAALYRRRKEHPMRHGALLALLAWTNVHSFAVACVLTSWFAFDLFWKQGFAWRKLIAIAFPIAAIGAVPVLLTPDATQGLQSYYGWLWVPMAGAAAICPGFQPTTYVQLALSALFWIYLAMTLVRSWLARSVVWAAWAWLGFIFMFKHTGELNHHGLIFVFFLLAWWLDEAGAPERPAVQPRGRRIAVGLCTLMVMMHVARAGIFYVGHRGRHFSGAQEMAGFIRAAGLEGQDLVAYPAYIGTALLPYLPNQKIYQMEDGQITTYITWTMDYIRGMNTPFSTLYEQMLQHFANRPDVPEGILLLCSDLTLVRPEWTLLFENSRPSVKEDEFFRLYRVPLSLDQRPRFQ